MADTAESDTPPAEAAGTGGAKQPKSDAADAPAAKADKKDNGKLTMHVRVSSPFKIFYDEQALSLSGENATGPFDILPKHHNFISLLNECELAIKTHTGVTRVRISGGFMHVKADEVVVFLNV